MHPTRLKLAPLVAGSLSLLLLSGCPNAGTQPPVNPTSASPSPVATTAATTSPSTSESPAAVASAPATTDSSTSPMPTASGTSQQVATLQGRVYDEAGALVQGASVHVRSLTTQVKFDSTVETTGGTYVMNSVPTGTQIEISVSKPNWTTRTRVESLLATSNATNTVNFGGSPSEPQDSRGAGYFISNFPEVTSANGVYDGSKLIYTVRFSEPLDVDNQRRVENALSITTPDPNGGFITIRKGTMFLTDADVATATWDTTGTTMTFTFPAPLRGDKNDKKTYTLTLSRSEGDEPIKDMQGNVLGLTAPNPGSAYPEAFKLSNLVLSTESTPQARWATTHTGSASFSVPKDDQAPKLVSLLTSPIVVNGVDCIRFIMVFNEPMRVYPKASGFMTSIQTLSNYTFALSDQPMDSVDMAATQGVAVNTSSDVVFNTPFQFGGSSGATVAFSDTDPKVLAVVVPRSVIPATAKFVKARVLNVQDPAGNAVSTGGANAADKTADNVKAGSL